LPFGGQHFVRDVKDMDEEKAAGREQRGETWFTIQDVPVGG